ncbi:hypothetical protein D3C85_1150250 [compost metagenome]
MMLSTRALNSASDVTGTYARESEENATMVIFTSPSVPLNNACPAAFTAFIMVLNSLLLILPLESSTKATLKSLPLDSATMAVSFFASGVSSSTLIASVPVAVSPSPSTT